MTVTEIDGDWVCTCGNRPDLDGFFPCLPDGTQVEPTRDSPWDGHTMTCDGCGTVFSTHGIVKS